MSAGRLRRALDADRAAGAPTSASALAALQILADQIDAVDRMLRRPGMSPYDRSPLVALVKQFDAMHARAFPPAAGADPLQAAFEKFGRVALEEVAVI